ncbi:MAG: hypothetical protein WB421_01050 [Terriglobales bacterium]|jgi:hypothetical protein
MKRRFGTATNWITGMLVAGTLVAAPLAVSAQTETPQPTATYQPKFKGDPARSDSEALALGYMRTVIRAQKEYHKKYDKYAATLADLVGGARSFTKRMTQTDRGDYTVSFHSHKDKDSYELAMTPKQLDALHRSFYAKDDGVIHGDEEKAADENSPVVK